jgi:hypothetical protein
MENLINLVRVSIIDPGAFGVMINAKTGVPFALTIERTFENNLLIIPPGLHRCFKSYYHHGNYTVYEIEVSGHSNVYIHKGNIETDFKGCVGVGESFGFLNRKPAILQSGVAFDELMNLLGDVPEFGLNIIGG